MIKTYLLYAAIIGAGGWYGYTEWLNPWLEPVPQYVFELAWYCFGAWGCWHLLQRSTR
jgi:hypothetical protein